MISAVSSNALPRVLRLCAVALVLAAIVPSNGALADDFLRGTFSGSAFKGYSRWDGFYFGLTANESIGHATFGSGTADLVAFILRDTAIENDGHVSQWNTNAPSSARMHGFGGFLGYNVQSGSNLYLGLEGTYTKLSSNSITSADTEGRSFTEANGTTVADVTVANSISVNLKDYATLRGRAGYSVGQFLPYAFIGAAVARGTLDRTVSVNGVERVNGVVTGQLNPNPTIDGDHTNFQRIGAAAGVGIEATILPNAFLRVEYEYALFSPVSGIKLNLQSARVGIGLKF
jgi:opacity protein-like surface antigen